MGEPVTRSSAEVVKENSHHLRGTVIEELQLERPDFSKETVQVLKFHGIYQQTDRDERKQGNKVYGSMVRVGVPGGVLTPGQYLAMDRLADEAGDGGLRITSRQDIQYHRVQKPDLPELIRTLNRNLLGTLAACGDVVRNVTACPAPLSTPEQDEVYGYVRSLAKRLKPRTTAYYEIWLDGEKTAAVESAPESEEPLYGATYLPRKFKIGFAAPGENCVDVFSNDVGVIPIYAGAKLQGFTLAVGGGLGMSPGVKASHPRLADPVCSVPPELLEEAVEAIVTIHRDYGNRVNRRLARLKYVMDDWGVPRFKQELETRLGRTLDPPHELSWSCGDDHLGWHTQAGGAWYLGVRVLSGRIRDTAEARLRSGLREVVERYQPGVRFTSQQNILLTGIAPQDRAGVEEILQKAGIALAPQLPPVMKNAMACPALPTCGLAITEAERMLPDFLEEVYTELKRAGIGDLPVSIRVTGCPNGCARSYTAEIGLVGQSVDLYVVYLGGSPLGTRLGAVFAENVRRQDIAGRLRPLFARFSRERQAGERFGDYCHRVGVEALRDEPVLSGSH